MQHPPQPASEATTGDTRPLVMYSTQWCGYCVRLKSQLARAGIEIEEVSVERDAAAEEFVRSVNGGNAVVPTVVFPDGTVRTNPSYQEVLRLLQEP